MTGIRVEFWIEETRALEPRGMTRSIEWVCERREATSSREVR
jgi:hypothetical protein